MTRSRKLARPANDQPRPVPRALTYVALRRPFDDAKKGGAGVILVIFLLALIVVLAASLKGGMEPAPQTQASIPKPKPFDIVLSDSELAPSAAEAEAVAAILPQGVLAKKTQSGGKLAPVLQITVEGDEADDAQADAFDKEEKAERLAGIAKNLLRQGEIEQALSFQERAVALDPAYAPYRLALGILYDRLGSASAAAEAYRRVLQAHEAKDEMLPDTLDIEGIRRRLVYLTQGKDATAQ